MKSVVVKTAFLWGTIATLGILGAYFAALTLISGSAFAFSQFGEFRFFIVSLALGFGIQAGLYGYLKAALREHKAPGAALAVTGATSTVAMVSCCAHYLVNILPVLGAAGIATFAAAYQTEFFWFGIAMNLAGIAFMVRRIMVYNYQRSTISTN
jgi:Cu+-exporting ATPase